MSALVVALTLAWPSPALALRPAGLEEGGVKAALLRQLSETSRLRPLEDLRVPAAALRHHPGGPIESLDALREFLRARGVTGSWSDDHLRVVADAENVHRLRENQACRETDQPLRPLLAWNQRLRMVNYLQRYAGGALPLKTLADATGYLTIFQFYPRHRRSDLDFHEVAAADNALRLEANVARRAADLPLLLLTAAGRDLDTTVLDALQRSQGGYLPMKELTDAAGISPTHMNRLGWTRGDRNGQIAAENARRQRANVIRRALGKPPIPRVARDPTTAIQYALEDWWKAEPPTQEEIVAFANISGDQFARHFNAALAAANAARAAHHLPLLPATLASAAGLEEPAPFVPWAGASDRVLVRAGRRRPLPDYPPLTIERLYEFLTPHLQRYLQETYGIDETPLVQLPGATRAFGKPVFLLREALLPTGSSKPRMLAALFDLYQNEDPWNLTGRRGLPLPKVLGTQSTGNHLQAMAWFGQTIRSWGALEWGRPVGWSDLQVIGFTMRGIPEQKRHTAQRFGATVWDQFADYGEARQAMERMARDEGETFLRWNHGDRPIVLGNATMAIQLQAQMERQRLLRGRRVAIVSAAGAGGRIAGLSAGLTQGQGGSFTVIGAETDRIRPLFEAAKAGKPVPIALPPQRVPEDGIAVDQVEAEALRVFLSRGDAVALVDPAQALSYTRWLLEELAGLSGQTSVKQWPTHTEVVTGMSLAVPFLYPALFEDVDAVIIDETGMNIDPDDLRQVRAVPLPEPAAAGLEEPLGQQIHQALAPKLGAEYKVVVKDTPDTITVHLARPGHGRHSLVLTIIVQAAPPPSSAWFVSINHPLIGSLASSGPFAREEVVPSILTLLQRVRDRFDSVSGLPASFESPPTPDWLLTVTKEWQFLRGPAAGQLARFLRERSGPVWIMPLGTEREMRRPVPMLSAEQLFRVFAQRPDDLLLGIRPDGQLVLVDRRQLREEPNSDGAIRQLEARALSDIEVVLIEPSAAQSWQYALDPFLRSTDAGAVAVVPLVDPRDSAPLFDPWFTAVVRDRTTREWLGVATTVRGAYSGDTVRLSSIATRGAPAPARLLARVLAEAVFAVAKEAGAKDVMWKTSTDDRTAAVFDATKSSWSGGTVGTSHAVALRDETLRRSLEVKDAPEIESVFGGGLEERSAARWRALAEGQTGPKGILVIPAGVLGFVEGLSELLEQLPDGLAQQVLVWQETDTVLAIQRVRAEHGHAPLRVLRRAGAPADLADYLYWLLQEQDVTRIGVLGWNETSASQLQAVLNRLREPGRLGSVSVKAVPASDLAELLKMLGVPEPVSQQVGLEELLGEVYTLSGT